MYCLRDALILYLKIALCHVSLHRGELNLRFQPYVFPIPNHDKQHRTARDTRCTLCMSALYWAGTVNVSCHVHLDKAVVP